MAVDYDVKLDELTEVFLDRPATSYLETFLEQKGDTLSMLTLAHGLPPGVTFAYLPSSIHPEPLPHFTEGGVMGDSGLVDIAKLRAARFVAGFLNASAGRIAVSETYFDANSIINTRVSIPFFAYRPTRYGSWDGRTRASHDSGTCLYLTSKNVTRQDVDELVCGVGRPDIAFLTRYPSETETTLRSGEEVSHKTLELLALEVVHIIVPVYDSETYLIWSRLPK